MVLRLIWLINISDINSLKIGISFIFIIFIALMLVLIYLMNDMAKNKIKAEEDSYIFDKIKTLEQGIKNINILFEDNAKNFHDFKNHIAIIDGMAENEQYDEMKKYIKQICIKQKYSSKYVTGNKILDMVLNVKAFEIDSLGIDFECNIKLNNEITINPTDLCSITTNLLDNAIEANKEINEKRYIKFELNTKGNIIAIRVLNSSFQDPIKNGFVSSKRGNHGWGTKIIREIVEKYNGNIDLEYKDDEFSTYIVLIQ